MRKWVDRLRKLQTINKPDMVMTMSTSPRGICGDEQREAKALKSANPNWVTEEREVLKKTPTNTYRSISL